MFAETPDHNQVTLDCKDKDTPLTHPPSRPPVVLTHSETPCTLQGGMHQGVQGLLGALGSLVALRNLFPGHRAGPGAPVAPLQIHPS
jgi:hypothetical protein